MKVFPKELSRVLTVQASKNGPRTERFGAAFDRPRASETMVSRSASVRDASTPEAPPPKATFEFKMVLTRPVVRPRHTEKGCSNSEGGVRPGLCYHPRGGQPHTKSPNGISTAKASVCRANRRVKALPHHPACTIEPGVSKRSTGGNVATWRARTAFVVWKDISDAL